MYSSSFLAAATKLSSHLLIGYLQTLAPEIGKGQKGSVHTQWWGLSKRTRAYDGRGEEVRFLPFLCMHTS